MSFSRFRWRRSSARQKLSCVARLNVPFLAIHLPTCQTKQVPKITGPASTSSINTSRSGARTCLLHHAERSDQSDSRYTLIIGERERTTNYHSVGPRHLPCSMYICQCRLSRRNVQKLKTSGTYTRTFDIRERVRVSCHLFYVAMWPCEPLPPGVTKNDGGQPWFWRQNARSLGGCGPQPDTDDDAWAESRGVVTVCWLHEWTYGLRTRETELGRRRTEYMNNKQRKTDQQRFIIGSQTESSEVRRASLSRDASTPKQDSTEPVWSVTRELVRTDSGGGDGPGAATVY
ncbi:hypothetical protein CBL_04552 [Carabus blaptoides fortunei]